MTADRTGTTTSPSIATSLAAQSNAAARMKILSIQNLADVLAALMHDAHGGEWKVECDHVSGFVLIRRTIDNSMPRPRKADLG